LKKSNTILTILLFVFFTAGAFFTVGSGNEAWGQGCTIDIVKLIQGNNESFEFTLDDGKPFQIFLSDGDVFSYSWGPNTDLTITEVLPVGWRLDDVVCFNDGVGITDIDSIGIIASCEDLNGGHTECIFVNVDPSAIPTLSEWGMIAAAAGLGLVGMFFAIRRKRAQAV